MRLPSADDLFSTQAERDDAQRERVQDIPLDLIDGFPDHPFQVRDDEAMQAMVESIGAVGIHTPLLVRPKDDGRYEIISGHRRKHAATLAGLASVPVIIREMTRDEAIIAMIDANLQREVILPSEKAFSYKMKLEALSRQGKRTDLTSSPMEMKLKGKQSLAVVGEAAGDGKDTVHRYIRLTSLLPDILLLVDNGKIAFRPAVELSFLQENEQAALLEAMQAQEATPSLAQSIKIKLFSQGGKLTSEVIESIMAEEKPNQREKTTFSPKVSKLFAPGTPPQKMEDIIIKAVPFYLQRLKKRDTPEL